jgi:Tfp pilus assembly protein PilX
MKTPKKTVAGPAEDRGAALVLVLVIVTVIGLVGAALLTFSDTSIRTTVALRDQAAAAYAADGAAQVAINEIQSGKLDCASTTPQVLNLGTLASPFYIPVQSQVGPLNASTTCSPNTVEGATSTTTTTTTGTGTTVGGTANNLPSYALLALGSASTDFGIDFSRLPTTATVCIENGSVVSNMKITIGSLRLGVRLSGTGTPSDCSTGSGTGLTVGAAATGGCISSTGSFSPTPCTHLAAPISLPSAPVPSDPITRTNVAAHCLTSGSTKYAAFLPGKYTNVALLNTPCSGGTVDFEWFSPGTYYFDFGSTPWTWPTTLLAGTPTNSSSTPITTVDASNAASLAGLANVAPFPTASGQKPNSCADPALQSSSPGAEFVFGGASTVTPNAGGNAEICATYSPTSAPIAIYGAQTTVTVTGGSVSPQTLCTVSGCTGSLIATGNNGRAQFYIRGFVYAPNAPIVLTLKNSYGQLFNWGVVVRNFSLAINGSSPTASFIQLPSANQGITTTTTTTTTYTIRYVNVWTCQATGTPCPQTGTPNVRVKVQTNGSLVKVLSWSVQR